MAINFTDSPANGATITQGNSTFTYNSTYGVWDRSIAASAISVYATLANLPLSDVSDDTIAKVLDTDKLYIWDGTGWYYLPPTNTNPTITTASSATYELATDGTPTVVTLDANDPEGLPITWSYAVTTGALGSTATVSQNNNVFTITPSTDSGDAGDFTLTFTASDGVNIATSASEFSLSFVPSWASASEQQLLQHTWAGYASAANDYFGSGVSLSDDGNTAIVGAWGEDNGGTRAGAAYIFTRSGTTWTELAELKASNPSAYDYFGVSVDMSGDGNTAIVGARNEDTTASDSGAAYIFTRSGSTWTEQVMLKASDLQAQDALGVSVSISADGNTAIVGAVLYRGGAQTGAAYIFARSGSTWSQQAKVQAPNLQAVSEFGKQVSISGDGNTAIVGAKFEDVSGSDQSGFVYIFARSGSAWSQQVRLTTPGGETYAYFGSSVSLSSNGNTAIVGAEGSKFSGYAEGERSAGAAHIFTRSGTTWTHEARIQASDAGHFYDFGSSVSMSNDGNTVIVGDPDNDTGGDSAGAVYLFTRDGTTWTELSMLQASDVVERQNDANALEFGKAVALSGDGNTAIVGAESSDLVSPADRGAAYIFVAG
jgi:hypothetical protein